MQQATISIHSLIHPFIQSIQKKIHINILKSFRVNDLPKVSVHFSVDFFCWDQVCERQKKKQKQKIEISFIRRRGRRCRMFKTFWESPINYYIFIEFIVMDRRHYRHLFFVSLCRWISAVMKLTKWNEMKSKFFCR